MGDYISRDTLIEDIEKTISESGCVNHDGEIMDCVRYADAADVAPVVRGQWTAHKGKWPECSRCGHRPPLRGTGSYAYCPSCGAKMEGES